MKLSRASEDPAKVDNVGSSIAAHRIALLYALRHRRLPDLLNPTRFTELVQLRKLNDRSPLQTTLLDKLEAKRLASEQLGANWIVPTLWQGQMLPRFIPFALPSIVKARHGCNQYQILETFPDCERWKQVQRAARRWQRREYGRWLDEWAYRKVPRGVFAEPLLGGARPLPIDYKIYVFGGVATHVQVHLGRGVRHRWILHDRNWRQLVPAADRPSRPSSLGAMLQAAETLAGNLAFVRVDFTKSTANRFSASFAFIPALASILLQPTGSTSSWEGFGKMRWRDPVPQRQVRRTQSTRGPLGMILSRFDST